jgi:hypothetical protein
VPPDPLTDDDMGGESEPLDEFETFASKAWPDMAGDSERIMAAKEAIKICLEADQAGDYGDKPPPKKGGSGLALIFEGPKKKGG